MLNLSLGVPRGTRRKKKHDKNSDLSPPESDGNNRERRNCTRIQLSMGVTDSNMDICVQVQIDKSLQTDSIASYVQKNIIPLNAIHQTVSLVCKL